MGATVSKGFLVFAENKQDVDYVKQAYALALSIKYSQKEVTNISIVTNDPVPKKYQKVFDQIIPIPWYKETDATDPFKGSHRWKFFHITPYDETIVLDTDMLLLEDISDWWHHCSKYDIKFCNRVTNYKQDKIESDTYHRKAFISNNLTNPYFALHYFKKTDPAYEFYKVLEFVCNNWEHCYSIYAPEYYQDWLSMDLASAIAIEISGQFNSVIDTCSPLEFVHMKIPLQGWPVWPDSWQNSVPFVLNPKGELIVGNIKQTKLFHYVEKNFLNKELIRQLEEIVNGV